MPKHIYIVYQTDLNPTAQGGGVRYVQGLLDYLLDQGWRVTFLGAGDFSRSEHPGLRFCRVSSLNCSWLTFFFGLFAFLWRHRNWPDGIIHIHRGYFAIPFLLLKPRSTLVCTLHGDTLLVLGAKSKALRLLVTPLFRLIEMLCLIGISRVIVVDEGTAGKFLDRYPFTWLKEKIIIIPSAVDVQMFSPGDKLAARQYFGFNPNDEIVLFIGRLAKIKNIPFLLRVFSGIERHRPRARLLLAGDGDERPSLIEYTEKLGLTRVIFMGPVAHRDIPKLMQASNVLALCSNSEASPIVVKEALACGLPVVSTPVGDVKHVITGRNLGTIVSRDESAFYEALLERLQESISGNKNQETPELQNFATQKIYQRIVEIYQNAGALVPN